MVRLTLYLLGAIAWAGATYGVLHVGFLDLGLGHVLCGPWGCAPPLEALLAMHGFWAMVLLLPTAWAISTQPPACLRLLGAIVFGLSLASLAAVAIHEMMVWLPDVPTQLRRYYPQRLFLVVVTMSDYPMLQAMLAGATCWVVGWARGTCLATEADPSAAAAQAQAT